MRMLLQKVRQGDYYSVVSRFACSRRAYSRIQAARQKSIRNARIDAPLSESQILSAHEVRDAVMALREDGLAKGIALPGDLVEDLRAYAEASPCSSKSVEGQFFSREVDRGALPDGRVVLNASVEQDEPCDAMETVVGDPAMLKIAEDYLGYVPSRIETELKWSFRSDIPEAIQWERAQRLQDREPEGGEVRDSWKRFRRRAAYLASAKQSLSPIYLHYDVFGYNSVRVYFYLTDVTRDSGAHVTIRKSHDKKSMHMLMSPGIYSEDRLRQYYGSDSEDIIEGPAGTGFFEDVACYHKLLPPTEEDRLVLAITYR